MADHEAGVAPKARRVQGNRDKGGEWEQGRCPSAARSERWRLPGAAGFRFPLSAAEESSRIRGQSLSRGRSGERLSPARLPQPPVVVGVSGVRHRRGSPRLIALGLRSTREGGRKSIAKRWPQLRHSGCALWFSCAVTGALRGKRSE